MNGRIFIPQKQLIEVDIDTLKSYTGKYKLRRNEITISLEKEGLMIRLNNDRPQRMYFTSNIDFFMLERPGSEQKLIKN